MTFNPLKRDSTWRMVLPGLYFDPAGAGHIFPDEFLAYLALQHPEKGFDPTSQEDYDGLVNFLLKTFPDRKFQIVRHERETH